MSETKSYEQMIDESDRHALAPEAGDYWHEMFSPVLVVIEAGRFSVTFCETTKPTDANHWTWDLDRPLTTLTRETFNKKLRYNSMPDKTWCHCAPRSHAWAVDAAIAKAAAHA